MAASPLLRVLLDVSVHNRPIDPVDEHEELESNPRVATASVVEDEDYDDVDEEYDDIDDDDDVDEYQDDE